MIKRISVLALLLCLFALPALADGHSHAPCTVEGCTETMHAHDPVEFAQPIEADFTGGPLSGTAYYLEADVTLTQALELTHDGTVYLCLNGKMITQTASLPAVSVTGGSLVLCDCGNGVIKHETTTFEGFGNGVSVNGDLTMYGGTITDNVVTGGNGGGGAYVSGAMTMYGGTISGNRTNSRGGGGVYAAGTMTMHGGKITGNKVVNAAGGGVYAVGTMTMHGGTISSNNAMQCGGVYTAGAMMMYGGEITDNISSGPGGGVGMSQTGSLTMHGGKISGNESTYGSGGGVNVSGALIMHGGEISGNTADEYGGGVNLYWEHSTLTMSGGVITGNQAQYGGGVAPYSNNIISVSGDVQITGNTATGKGHNVYLTGEKILLEGPLGDDAAIGVTVKTLQQGQSAVYMEAAEGKTVSEADMAKTVSDDGYTQWIHNGAAEMYVAGVYVQARPANRGTASGGGAYQPGDTVTLTAEATVPGFGFVGWYQDDVLVSTENPYVFTLETVAEEFTAQFEMIEYTLTYDLDGGVYPEGSEGNPASYTVRTSSFTLVNPEKENYIFLGWEESGELKKTVRISSGSTGNRAFKAKWAPVEYAITYILPEGTDNSANPKVYTVETPTFTLAAPTKPGYTFMGWIETEGGKPQLNVTIEQGSTGERTFEAVFEMSEYALTYDLDGGAYPAGSAGNPASYTVATESFTLVNPEKANYTFLGWEENGELRKVVTIEKGSTGDRVFKAKYGPVEYAITYILPKGADNSANPAAYTVATPTFTLAAPTKPGYMFMGWIETEGGKPQLNVTIEQGSTGERTFEAVFKELPPLPQTGDNSSLMLSAALLALSGAGFAAMRRKRRAE